MPFTLIVNRQKPHSDNASHTMFVDELRKLTTNHLIAMARVQLVPARTDCDVDHRAMRSVVCTTVLYPSNKVFFHEVTVPPWFRTLDRQQYFTLTVNTSISRLYLGLIYCQYISRRLYVNWLTDIHNLIHTGGIIIIVVIIITNYSVLKVHITRLVICMH
jgi:hypothetical protein